jgi:Predicted amidophosphoribosyltransferases
MDDARNFPTFFSRPLSALLDSCLTLVYPQPCKICEKSVESRAFGAACRQCWRKTRIFDGTETICDKCGAFLKFGGASVVTFCRNCDDDFFDCARAAGLYERALLTTILELKNTPHVPSYLRKIFLETFLKSPFQDADVIVPVPLSRGRLSERGYNQAALPARILARKTGLAIDEKILVRVIHTPKHRAGMDKKARSESVENAFEVALPERIEGKKILLIDDVFTSGATASNCAKALKEKGADKVYILTIARAF